MLNLIKNYAPPAIAIFCIFAASKHLQAQEQATPNWAAELKSAERDCKIGKDAQYLEKVKTLIAANHLPAMSSLASKYVEESFCSKSVEPRYLEALELWKTAARQGHMDSMQMLSAYYGARGRGKIRQDPIASAKWALINLEYFENLKKKVVITKYSSEEQNFSTYYNFKVGNHIQASFC